MMVAELSPLAPPVIDTEPPHRVRRPVMLQDWRDAAFLHWPVDPADVQRLLPDGLTVDTFDGSGWVGLIAFDMVGIRFANHPDFKRILCPDDWEGWPLRKDYTVQEYYRGMPVPYPADEDPDEGGTWVFADRFKSGEGGE